MDLVSSVRSFIRRPSLALAAAVLAMALGIGAGVAIFSVVDGVLISPLPYEDPDTLVVVWNRFSQIGLPKLELSLPELFDYRERTQTLAELAATYRTDTTLTGIDEPRRAAVALVTPNLFDILETRPLMGRVFSDDDARPDAPRVAVLSEGMWRRVFGGDSGVVGSTISLNGFVYTVSGVVAARGAYPEGVDLWVPLRLDPADLPSRGRHEYRTLARLEPGVTLDSARVEIETIAQRLQQENPAFYPSDSGWGATVVSLKEEVTGDAAPALLILLGAVGLVVLIACANTTNILLARTLSRSREISIRSALGASRGRLVLGFVSESLAIGLLGGVLGLLLAWWSLDLLIGIHPDAIPRLGEIGVDWRIVAFALALSLASGLVTGLAPALQSSNPNLVESLKEGGEKSTGSLGKRRVRQGIVVAETALALVLAVSAGLLVKDFNGLQEVDPGFDPREVLTARISLPTLNYREGSRISAFYEELLRQTRSLPGVESAGVIDYLPLGGEESSGSIEVEGHPVAAGSIPPEADLRSASPGYFEALGIPLIRGRAFQPQDRGDAAPVAVVDTELADRFWPQADPLGRRIRIAGGPWRQVVGVVGHVKHTALDAESREQLYVPFAQAPVATAFLAVRTGSDPLAATEPIRSIARSLEHDAPLFGVQTMEERVGRALAPNRLSTVLLSTLATLAVVLAALGLYSVIAYSTARLSKEIGVRMSLGAARGQIFRRVVGQGLRLALIGVALGLLISFWATRLLSSILFGVSALDPAAFLTAAIVLALVAVAASYLPALKAARVDPAISLGRE